MKVLWQQTKDRPTKERLPVSDSARSEVAGSMTRQLTMRLARTLMPVNTSGANAATRAEGDHTRPGADPHVNRIKIGQNVLTVF